MSISFGACPNKHNFKNYLQQNVDNVKIHILLQTDFLKTDMWERPMGITNYRNHRRRVMRRVAKKKLFNIYNMGKRRYNFLSNLRGFVNLSNKKRKTAKASSSSNHRNILVNHARAIVSDDSEKENVSTSEITTGLTLNLLNQLECGHTGCQC